MKMQNQIPKRKQNNGKLFAVEMVHLGAKSKLVVALFTAAHVIMDGLHFQRVSVQLNTTASSSMFDLMSFFQNEFGTLLLL